MPWPPRPSLACTGPSICSRIPSSRPQVHRQGPWWTGWPEPECGERGTQHKCLPGGWGRRPGGPGHGGRRP
eukprot:14829491-Alexandrium_andersonii.AAC.1